MGVAKSKLGCHFFVDLPRRKSALVVMYLVSQLQASLPFELSRRKRPWDIVDLVYQHNHYILNIHALIR
jgi:hypothetical protein